MTKKRLARMDYHKLVNYFDAHWNVATFVRICRVYLDQQPGVHRYKSDDILRTAVYIAEGTTFPPQPDDMQRLILWALEHKSPVLMDIPDSILLNIVDNPPPVFRDPVVQDSPIGGTMYTGVADNYYGA